MVRLGVVAVVALVIVLVVPAGAPPVGASGEVAVLVDVPFVLSDCAYAEFSLELPRTQAVLAAVPAEFPLRGLSPATVSVVLGAAVCDEATADGVVGTAAFWWTDVVVYPPAWLRAPGVNFYLYRVDNLVVDDRFGDLMAAVDAQRRVVASIDVALGPLVRFGVDFGDEALDAFATPHAAVRGADVVTYREVGPAAGGYAVLEARLVAGEDWARGPGALTLVEGTAAWDILGPAFAGHVHAASSYRFEAGRMMLVVPPA